MTLVASFCALLLCAHDYSAEDVVLVAIATVACLCDTCKTILNFHGLFFFPPVQNLRVSVFFFSSSIFENV